MMRSFTALFSLSLLLAACGGGRHEPSPQRFPTPEPPDEELVRQRPAERSPRFLAGVEAVCRMHLFVDKDPAALSAFLSVLAGDERLTEAEEDAIAEWRSVAREWATYRATPDPVGSAIHTVAHSERPEEVIAALNVLVEHHRFSPRPDSHRLRIFYLKEIIHRAPHTMEAARAYRRLEVAARMEYSGSAGEHVPRSVYDMLARYQRMAEPREGPIAL